MKQNKKYYILILVLMPIIFLTANFCLAARSLELDYPYIPGAGTLTTTSLLPDFVKYIFNFAIGISGILAFGVLIFAGIQYLTSAGNPGKMTDAMDRIKSAFLGLVILLCSWIILTTINPQLVEIPNRIIPTQTTTP